MPFHESDSIILKTYPLAEADRIVVFFSEKYGKVRGVANGARKLKNRFGASLEPLAQSRLRFFQKEGSDLVRIRSSELLDSPMKLFEDYDRAVLASHLADLVDRFLPEYEAQDSVFRLFCLARRSLLTGCSPTLSRCYFDVWMLRLAGVFPDLFRCSSCSRQLNAAEERSLGAGFTTVLCRTCGTEASDQIPPTTISALGWILTTSLDVKDATPDLEGLQHIQRLNNFWIDRYFER